MGEIKKSWQEINAKLAAGKAIVLTGEEVAKMSKEASPKEIAKKVDVVTTATFGAMCSSGFFINFGHSDPPIRMEEISLDGVPACAGLAAVDAYMGATEVHRENPRFGGAHVLERLISGQEVHLIASGKGTDCYPRREIDTWIHRDRVNEIIVTNPRNAYQNYPAATNSTKKALYTYMGTLLPNKLNVNYSTSGCLSPLLNDPYLRTIGIGSPVFFAGAHGHVAWQGTQFTTAKARSERGIPESNAATLMLMGDARQMDRRWLRAAYFHNYGVSLYVGVGIAIPVLDEDMAFRLSIRDEEIHTSLCDYGLDGHPSIGRVNYRDLRSGTIEIDGKKVRTAPLSSLYKAREIAAELKNRVLGGTFILNAPIRSFGEAGPVKSLFEYTREPRAEK